MKKYQVDWTDRAKQAVRDILAYFPPEDIAHAEKILEGFFAAGDSLEIFPNRGREVPELKNLGNTNIRELFYKPWRIIYEVHSTNVEILSVIDGRRDLDEALMETLLRKN